MSDEEAVPEDIQKMIEEEAIIAAKADAALQAVRDECDAFRAALKASEE